MTAIEVIVVVALLGLLVLLALSALPRQRENARLAGCRRNLMQVGVALALYDRGDGVLPAVPKLAAEGFARPGPLRSVLDALALPDLLGLDDPSKPPEPRPGLVPVERPLAGFLCPSDLGWEGRDGLDAPVSYRATAGDQPSGLNGGFAPGRTLRMADVEAGDGKSYTAAFSERLLGTGRPAAGPSNYMKTSTPPTEATCVEGPSADWLGDAGASWAEASWRSTLYNHVRPPQARPSCVAGDGATAVLGASSAHANGVNVLAFDGSVRSVIPTVAPSVWKALATTESEGGKAAGLGPRPGDEATTP